MMVLDQLYCRLLSRDRMRMDKRLAGSLYPHNTLLVGGFTIWRSFLVTTPGDPFLFKLGLSLTHD